MKCKKCPKNKYYEECLQNNVGFIVRLTAEECVSMQNLLDKAWRDCGIITARKDIDKLKNKFMNPEF